MGSCYYYLLARFPTTKKAREFLPVFRDFLKEQAECYKMWQDIRNRPEPPRSLYEYLRAKFPRAMAWVRFYRSEQESNIDEDYCLNLLAGHLFSGPLEEAHLEAEENVIKLKCEEWHLADWAHLVEFCILMGEAKAQWTSEEYQDFSISEGEYPSDEDFFNYLDEDLVELSGVIDWWLRSARPWRNPYPFDGFRPPENRLRNIANETVRFLRGVIASPDGLFAEAHTMLDKYGILNLLPPRERIWLTENAVLERLMLNSAGRR
jgi:hypothetical protein